MDFIVLIHQGTKFKNVKLLPFTFYQATYQGKNVV